MHSSQVMFYGRYSMSIGQAMAHRPQALQEDGPWPPRAARSW